MDPNEAAWETAVLEFELPRGATAKVASRAAFNSEKAASHAAERQAESTEAEIDAARVSPAGVDQLANIALARAGGAFVLYVTAAAVELCKEARRQTISPQDVLLALESLSFGPEFVDECKAKRPKHAPTLKKYRGVYQGSINAWYSQISIAGQAIHLGSFASPEGAAKAYDRAIWSKLGTAAAELLNFPADYPEALKLLPANAANPPPSSSDT